jgi:superoxide dismutase, Fe-Mn family
MYAAKQFDSIKELNGISERTMTEHYKLYEGYVKKFNEIMDKLKQADMGAANQIHSDFRALKVELSFALGGVKNHEVYFEHLGGDGTKPGGKLGEMIDRDFGSFDDWKKDLEATGLAGRGWAWLAYDWNLGRLMNYIGDAQNSYPIWGAAPLVAMDVYEHAYFIDYGTKRADYIKAFFDNLNWGVVEKRFDSLMASS